MRATTSLHALERKGFVRRQRRSSVEGRERVRLRARARPRRRLRADRARRPRDEAPRGRRVDRGPRAPRGPRRDARLPLELGARARPRLGRDDERARRAHAARAPRRRRPRVRAQQLRRRGRAVRGRARALAEDDAERPELLFRHARALFIAATTSGDATSARSRTRRTARGRRHGPTRPRPRRSSPRSPGIGVEQSATRSTLHAAEALAEGCRISARAARVLAVSARIRDDRRRARRGPPCSPRQHWRWPRSSGSTSSARMRSTTIGMAKNYLGDPSGHRGPRAGARDRARRSTRRSPRRSLNNLAVVRRSSTGDFRRAEELYARPSARRAFGDAQAVRFIAANRDLARLHARALGRGARGADAFIAECEAARRTCTKARCAVCSRLDPDRLAASRTPRSRPPTRVELRARRRRIRSHSASARSANAPRPASSGELDEARDTASRSRSRSSASTGFTRALSTLAPFADELGDARRARGRARRDCQPKCPGRWRDDRARARW